MNTEESINGRALIFGTNQKERRLVRKEPGIHDDTFVICEVNLPQLSKYVSNRSIERFSRLP